MFLMRFLSLFQVSIFKKNHSTNIVAFKNIDKAKGWLSNKKIGLEKEKITFPNWFSSRLIVFYTYNMALVDILDIQ
jgi:hypothetical protein